MNIKISAENAAETVVNQLNTAKEVKSGSLDVFATPCMIALVEQAASELCERYLDEGFTTVGTMINISHLAASAVGSDVIAKVKVTDFDGRKICFDAEVFDNSGLIGKGIHERFIVSSEKFMLKAESRLKNADN